MQKVFLFLTALFLASTLYSQALRSDTIHVSHYDIQLNIKYLSHKTIAGKATLTIHALKNNVSRVRLDLLHLSLDSIKAAGQGLNAWSYNDTLLSIPLMSPMNSGDSLLIEVYYHGQPVSDPSGWGGFYFSSDSLYAFNLGVGFYDNPHNYGRVWFPCIDDFHDRATYAFDLRVKDDKAAICNGSLEAMTLDTLTHTARWQWKLHAPIPAYLASVAVGPYAVVRDTFQGLTGSVPIAIYVPANKVAAAQSTFVRLKQVLAAFEWAYGPYRWERVGYVGVPFGSGAMEHATNIALGLGFINGNQTYESLYAHELSHHWFGDLVTCNSEAEMWLNEGWAVFSEGLYREILDGKEDYKNFFRHLNRTTIQNAHKDDGAYLDLHTVPHQNTYGTTVYDKGATVAHSIRGYLGDSLFFSMLHAYFNTHAFSHISNDGFRDFISSQTGINMQSFFDAWVKQAGWTHFSVDSFTSTPAASGYDVRVYLRQKLHHKPILANDNRVEVAMMDNNWQRQDGLVQFSGATGSALFHTAFKPDFVLVDPEERLADATCDYRLIIKNTGLINLADAFCKIDVKQLSDSALLRVMHSWAAPDTLGANLTGLSLSKHHYWTVKGIFPQGFDATGRFFYSKYGGLDDDIIIHPQDSLVILWRKQAGDPWHKVDFEQQGSWSAGYMLVPHLKAGEYVLASWDQAYASISGAMGKSVTFKVRPNPARHKVYIRGPRKELWTLQVFSADGRLLDAIGPQKQNYTYYLDEQWPKGLYYFIFSNDQGKILDLEKVLKQ